MRRMSKARPLSEPAARIILLTEIQSRKLSRSSKHLLKYTEGGTMLSTAALKTELTQHNLCRALTSTETAYPTIITTMSNVHIDDCVTSG